VKDTFCVTDKVCSSLAHFDLNKNHPHTAQTWVDVPLIAVAIQKLLLFQNRFFKVIVAFV